MNGLPCQSLKRERRMQPNFAYASGSEVQIVFTFLRGMLLVAVLASILFAHGCHGDEDHELFNLLRACVAVAHDER